MACGRVFGVFALKNIWKKNNKTNAIKTQTDIKLIQFHCPKDDKIGSFRFDFLSPSRRRSNNIK